MKPKVRRCGAKAGFWRSVAIGVLIGPKMTRSRIYHVPGDEGPRVMIYKRRLITLMAPFVYLEIHWRYL